MTSYSDQQLLIEFRDPLTKQAAFTALVKKYQKKVYWLVRRMVVSNEDKNK